jgi:hypothetical protein
MLFCYAFSEQFEQECLLWFWRKAFLQDLWAYKYIRLNLGNDGRSHCSAYRFHQR